MSNNNKIGLVLGIINLVVGMWVSCHNGPLSVPFVSLGSMCIAVSVWSAILGHD